MQAAWGASFLGGTELASAPRALLTTGNQTRHFINITLDYLLASASVCGTAIHPSNRSSPSRSVLNYEVVDGVAVIAKTTSCVSPLNAVTR